MEKRFLVERMETNLLIKNTLESFLKSFNDLMLFNMNLSMQQRLPPSIQPTPPPPTTVPPPITTEYLVLAPPPSPPKSPPSIPQPPSTTVWQWWSNPFLFLFKPKSFDNNKGGESIIGILIYKTLVLSTKFNKTSVLVVTYVCFHIFQLFYTYTMHALINTYSLIHA